MKKMMLSIFAAATLAILPAAVLIMTLLTSSAQATPAQVYGKWTNTMTNNGIVFTFVFDFSEGSLTLTNTCKIRGESIPVSITVASEVTDTQISIKESAHNEVTSPRGQHCDVSAVPGNMNYVVKGAVMTLTADGQTEKLILKRAK
jgi:hypothetical protein